MKVFSLVGYSDSGKTATAECVIRELTKRGYSVGSVKEIHNETFAMDSNPTSDTKRHRDAGAALVVARGLSETDALYPTKLDMRQILALFGGYDYVVCEGVRDYPLPTIMTASKVEDFAPKWSDLTFCVSGRIADSITEYGSFPAISAYPDASALVDLIEEKVFELLPNAEPGHCGHCGGDCWEMAKRILRGEAERSDCLGNTAVDLLVGGKRIDMQPFVERILRSTMLGLLKELKGYEDGVEISIQLR